MHYINVKQVHGILIILNKINCNRMIKELIVTANFELPVTEMFTRTMLRGWPFNIQDLVKSSEIAVFSRHCRYKLIFVLYKSNN